VSDQRQNVTHIILFHTLSTSTHTHYRLPHTHHRLPHTHTIDFHLHTIHFHTHTHTHTHILHFHTHTLSLPHKHTRTHTHTVSTSTRTPYPLAHKVSTNYMTHRTTRHVNAVCRILDGFCHGVATFSTIGSLKLYVSFAEYRLFHRPLLQKRPMILRSLLVAATFQEVGCVWSGFD